MINLGVATVFIISEDMLTNFNSYTIVSTTERGLLLKVRTEFRKNFLDPESTDWLNYVDKEVLKS